jgi:hypothetical protein
MYKCIFIFMSKKASKARVTMTIDEEILQRAKKRTEEKHIPVSRLIEGFLDFFSNPKVYCFDCGKEFHSSESELCPKCGWMKCPSCGICRCNLDEDIAKAVFYMRKVYEDLLIGRVE